jgi:hypothetical protein
VKRNSELGKARGRLKEILNPRDGWKALLVNCWFLTCALLAFTPQRSPAGIPEPDLVWYGKVVTSTSEGTVRLTTGTLAWQIEPVAGGPSMVVATLLTNINEQFSFVLRVPCESPEPGVGAATNVVNLAAPANHYRRVTVTLDGAPLSFISASNEFSPTFADRGRTERIDLRLGAAPPDSDGDGLADAWELQHFGSLNASAGGDPDGDGVNNLHEYRAGTNPNDAASRFEVVEISKVANGVSIRWSSQENRTYTVRRSTTLLAAPADYSPVQSGLVATPPMNQFIDTNANGGAHFFYLIEVQE